ncbi:hypothetical protein Tco_0608846, partial [Tanacetum coccineum]
KVGYAVSNGNGYAVSSYRPEQCKMGVSALGQTWVMVGDLQSIPDTFRSLVILFYNGLGIPTRQILDSRGAIPSKTVADAKVAIQEMVEYSQKWHNGTSRTRSTKTSDGLAVIQA